MGIKKYILTKMFLSGDQPERKAAAEIASRPETIKSNPDAPTRYEILPNVVDVIADSRGLKFPGFPDAMSTVKNTDEVELEIMQFNPPSDNSGKRQISDEDLQELEEIAEGLGCVNLGFCKLDHKYIFKTQGVIYENVIVVGAKMDREILKSVPSKQGGVMWMQSYNQASKAVFALAKRMREMGYDCQPSPSSVGPVLYPPTAAGSALGITGRHGLMIVADAGTPVRLAMIFTNIENLPVGQDQEKISAMRDYCSQCGKCVTACPAGAIYDEPIVHENGTITHIDTSKCIVQFSRNEGCGVCAKVCPQMNNVNIAIR